MKSSQGFSDSLQRQVAEILIQFVICLNMDEVVSTINSVMSDYGLCEDPYTHLPCSIQQYEKLSLEYERDIMIEKYGHCDGLDW